MIFQAACAGLCALAYLSAWIVARVKRLPEPSVHSNFLLPIVLTYALLAMRALK